MIKSPEGKVDGSDDFRIFGEMAAKCLYLFHLSVVKNGYFISKNRAAVICLEDSKVATKI